VGTGGTISTARAVLGGREQKAFDATSPVVAVTSLQDLAAWLGAMDLSTRRSVAGLPPGRADVFPTALATLIAIASAGSFASFHHSLFNLRYGVADETLAASARA
jgi:exopolyphosphatase/guanosine-5'-triphosphate,3'-diphosphate pyrophosphatase